MSAFTLLLFLLAIVVVLNCPCVTDKFGGFDLFKSEKIGISG